MFRLWLTTVAVAAGVVTVCGMAPLGTLASVCLGGAVVSHFIAADDAGYDEDEEDSYEP